MGFEYGQDTTIRVEVEGREYSAPVDSPEFIEYWRRNERRMAELEKYAHYTDKQIEEIPDEEADGVAKDSVRLCVEMVVALFGPEVAREIFNGRERSLTFCLALSDYVYSQFEEQDLLGKITKATRKYSPDNVQGD